jgi:hypothetical protein
MIPSTTPSVLLPMPVVCLMAPRRSGLWSNEFGKTDE